MYYTDIHALIFIITSLVDSMKHMVGSYPPKREIQSYLTPVEESPSGMMVRIQNNPFTKSLTLYFIYYSQARGSYSVTSLFTDDDKKEHLKWDWSFEIKKDWN